MATLTIKDIPPLDGDYPLDIASFTNRELHTIKQMSGVRAGELKEAALAADNDLVVAFTVIALKRAGQDVDPDLIWDADTGAITITPDLAEVEVRPPTSASPAGNESSNGDAESSSGNASSSGSSSVNDGDLSQSGRRATGHGGSELGSASDPVILAT